MEQEKIKKIYFYAIGVSILLLFVLLAFQAQEGNKCIANPLTYGAEKLSSEETGEFSCLCSFTNPNYEQVHFDKDNVSTLKDYYLK